MKNLKKVLSFVMATVLCLSFNVTAFASEAAELATPVVESTETAETSIEVFFVSSDGDVMPLASASIGGYGQFTLTNSSPGSLVTCHAEGIGGMGITVETSCSQTYDVKLIGGSATASLWTSKLETTISTNGHYEFHNLHQSGDFHDYLIALDGIRAGADVFVKVWIYG